MRDTTIDRAVALYFFILRYWVEQGYAPSVRDIQAHIQAASTSTVQHYLKVLIGWGWIEKPGSVRGIVITRASEVGMSRAQVALIAKQHGWWEA